jgi:hypothetical protein
VDGSEAALDKLRRLAADVQVDVADIRRLDVREVPVDGNYDIILGHNVLQFLGDDCLPTLRRIQDATVPGAFNAISVFTRETPSLEGRNELYRFDHNELKFRYEGWRLLFYGEEILWREPANMYLSFARIIAQKL